MTVGEKSNWHTLTTVQVHEVLKVENSGLSTSEIERRRSEVGFNLLADAHRRKPISMLLSQFSDFIVLVLIAAAAISFFLGEPEDTAAIVIIVVLNALLGFVQEFRAERAMEALKAMASTQAKVVRDGRVETIAASELVPGDVVHLEAGFVTPADIRLIDTYSLTVEEAALTGESQPVEKITTELAELDIPLGDKRNMAFKGTLITNGRALGLVVATGMQTELGKIATLLRSEKNSKTPLQKRLASFGKRLSILVIALCVVIFAVGIMRGEEPLLMFMTALSLAVAAIPEALPAVVTVSLALGAKRMVKQNALVRNLPAVETLGSVTYVCSDKTGTLTLNQMKVVAICIEDKIIRDFSHDIAATSSAYKLLFQAMALNNDASRHQNGEFQGDPTETALLESSHKIGIAKTELEKTMARVNEIPFSSERGMMTTCHKTSDGDIMIFTKGAPERVISRCRFTLRGNENETVPFDAESALMAADKMAKEGLRVLAFAYKRVPSIQGHLSPDEIENDLIFIGFAGLMDPPRTEVKAAIQLCQAASTKVVMITGDHPATAAAIAIELGIITEAERTLPMRVMTGKQLSQLSLEEFKTKVRDVRVYARVSPEQKIKIVTALQDCGEFVAMTGDGVNDAPALKKADIGVAMGKIGTDVAREAAHMVLLDDNFATIVSAMREGRRIFDNIRKFVKFVLAGNAAEILTLVLAPFLGLPIPFLPIHILWINIVTDGLPGLALAAEPEEKNLMQRPPRAPSESIFARGTWQHMLWAGLLMAAVCLGTQAWAYHAGNPHWQSMVFTVLTLSQMCHIFAVRSERESLFKQGLFSNKPLVGAVAITFLLQMMILYVPFFNGIFKTEPLTAWELLLCLAVCPTIFVAVEIEKLLKRRGLIFKQT